MRKGDIAVCILVLLIGIVLLCFQIGNEMGSTVEIYSDGTLFGKYELYSDKTVEVISKRGNNTVCINNGYVYVTDSSCEDKNEILQGKINQSGQSLICLPNKLVITVKGRRESVDSISY